MFGLVIESEKSKGCCSVQNKEFVSSEPKQNSVSAKDFFGRHEKGKAFTEY